jgi:cation diffusion facilitator family transporter
MMQATAVYFLVSILIMGIKFFAHFLTGSTSVLSDALESIINVTASGFALYASYLSSKPADDDHPYGHGKIEFFSAAFEGGLITIAGIWIAIESVVALLTHKPLKELDQGMVLIGIAGFGNLILGLYLGYMAKKKQSDLLKASSLHVLTDVFSTVAAFFGIFAVSYFGWNWADPLVAILIGVWLVRSGYKILISSANALMDSADPKMLDQFAAAVEKNATEGLIDIHLTKIMRNGPTHHVDCHMVVPQFWNISEAHEFAEKIEASIFKSYHFSGEINFHLDPCLQKYCNTCNVTDCPIRISPFIKRIPFSSNSLIRGPA